MHPPLLAALLVLAMTILPIAAGFDAAGRVGSPTAAASTSPTTSASPSSLHGGHRSADFGALPLPMGKVEIRAPLGAAGTGAANSTPGPPNITSVLPGAANATIHWTAPSTGGTVVTYQVAWGVEGQHQYLLNLSADRSSAVIGPLILGAHYLIEVAAGNSAGFGPFSRSANLTLTAWSELHGRVAPVNTSLTFDGSPLGVDPSGNFSKNSTPGPHELVARLAGFYPFTDAVTLPWNATIWANLSVEPEPGAIALVVRPSAAVVGWDGVNQTPPANGTYWLTGAGGSPHTLTVRASGYMPVRESVELPYNTTARLALTLVPLNGTIELRVIPVNAQVVLNGTLIPLDSRGRANVSRAPGNYSLVVAAPGFETLRENLTLGSGPLWSPVNLTRVPGTAPFGGAGPFGIPWFGWGAVALGVVVPAAIALARSRSRSGPPTTQLEPLPPGAHVWNARDAPENDDRVEGPGRY